MKIETLNEFVTLSHYLSFTTAAKKLYMSQSTLSKHIADLEADLNATLFLRGKKLELSPAGKVLFKDATQLIEQYKRLRSNCAEASAQSGLEIIVQEPILQESPANVLMEAALEFRARHPHTFVRHYSDRKYRPTELLDQHFVDIASTVDAASLNWMRHLEERESYRVIPLETERLFCMVQESNELSRRTSLSLAELVEHPLKMNSARSFDPIRFALVDIFKEATGKTPTFSMREPEPLYEFLLNWSNPSEVLVVTESAAKAMPTQQHQTKLIPLEDSNAQITTCALYRNDTKADILPEVGSIIEQMCGVVPSQDL